MLTNDMCRQQLKVPIEDILLRFYFNSFFFCQVHLKSQQITPSSLPLTNQITGTAATIHD